MSQKGFTLIELMVVVAVIGILVSLALPQYQKHIAKSQVSEAFILMNGTKTFVQENMQESRCLSTDSSKNTITGKYGDLVISGTPRAYTGNSNDTTDCVFTFNFNQNASSLIAGKEISADILNSNRISKNEDETTVDDDLLPKAFVHVEQFQSI